MMKIIMVNISLILAIFYSCQNNIHKTVKVDINEQCYELAEEYFSKHNNSFIYMPNKAVRASVWYYEGDKIFVTFITKNSKRKHFQLNNEFNNLELLKSWVDLVKTYNKSCIMFDDNTFTVNIENSNLKINSFFQSCLQSRTKENEIAFSSIELLIKNNVLPGVTLQGKP